MTATAHRRCPNFIRFLADIANDNPRPVWRLFIHADDWPTVRRDLVNRKVSWFAIDIHGPEGDLQGHAVFADQPAAAGIVKKCEPQEVFGEILAACNVAMRDLGRLSCGCESWACDD